LANGLFLQRETVPQIKQDVIDLSYNNLHLEGKQAKYLLFQKNRKYAFKRADIILSKCSELDK